MLTKDFFTKNRKNLYSKLEDSSMLLMFSGAAPHMSNDAYYPFEVNRNFYYLTGIQYENIVLMAVKFQSEIVETLFIERQDPLLAKWIGDRISVEEAKNISGVENILFMDNLNQKLVQILGSSFYNIDKSYFDFSRYAWDYSDQSPAAFAKELKDKYPYISLKDISKDLTDLRMIKGEEEVEKIKKAITITNEGVYNVMTHSKSGINEYELEAYFDFSLKSNGVSHAFETILASGKNAAILHYVDNNQTVKDNELILMDLGARVDNYCADISRTFPVNGKFTKRQREVYEVVLQCNKEIIEAMKPGVHMSQINELAKDILAEGCMKLDLIDDKKDVAKYYYHSIGHSLGLDTHDVGDRNVVLAPGMVYTCEPGLYIEEEGIGIRIEDDILITEDDNINLSKDIIKEVEDIEEYMGENK